MGHPPGGFVDITFEGVTRLLWEGAKRHYAQQAWSDSSFVYFVATIASGGIPFSTPTLKRTERVEEVGRGPQALIHARNHEEICVAL